MYPYLKMAWRNLWRNKRRTLITISSVVLSVVVCAVMSSLQEGSYEAMVNTAVRFNTGYIQVMDSNYWETKSVYNTISTDKALEEKIKSIDGVTMITPRLTGFSLISHRNLSKPVQVYGMDMINEDNLINLSDKLVDGEIVSNDDTAIMVSEGLADYMGIKTGDSIVLIGQGYHGVSAFGLYHVKGIIQHPNPILNKNMLYMPLSLKQEYLSAFGKISSYIIMVEDPYMVNDVAAAIRPLLDGSQKLLTWKEMEKALVQQIEGDRASAVIMKGILYMVVGFGMLGTVIMMMAERTRELAVMIAIGMKKFFVSVVLLIESLFIGITGALSGIILSIPVVFFLHKNPINLKGELAEIMLDYGFEPVMYASIHPSIFITQAIVVFFIALIIGLYPVWSISKMKAVEALRG